MTTPTFQRAYPPALPAPGTAAFWFPFRNGKLVVEQRGQEISIIERDQQDWQHLPALQPQSASDPEVLYIGTLDGKPCLAYEVSPESDLPAGMNAVDLRSLFGQIADVPYGVAGFASQLLYWVRTSRFCPVCGQQMGELMESWGRRCTQCDHIGYPPVIPAILVLIHDGGERTLLVHKPGWNKRYSIVAGFVEPGESLEQCVQREAREEVNIDVADITYIGSQPWPYPQQLMVGFTARYTGGDVQPDNQELDDAQWFRYDALPVLPAQLSLSWQIIHNWATSFGRKEE